MCSRTNAVPGSSHPNSINFFFAGSAPRQNSDEPPKNVSATARISRRQNVFEKANSALMHNSPQTSKPQCQGTALTP
jgi:hypothetical protein